MCGGLEHKNGTKCPAGFLAGFLSRICSRSEKCSFPMFTPKLMDSEDPVSRKLDIQRLIPLSTSHTTVEGSSGALLDLPDHAGFWRIVPEYP